MLQLYFLSVQSSGFTEEDGRHILSLYGVKIQAHCLTLLPVQFFYQVPPLTNLLLFGLSWSKDLANCVKPCC